MAVVCIIGLYLIAHVFFSHYFHVFLSILISDIARIQILTCNIIAISSSLIFAYSHAHE